LVPQASAKVEALGSSALLLLLQRLPFEFFPSGEEVLEFGLGFAVRFVGFVELLVIGGDVGFGQLRFELVDACLGGRGRVPPCPRTPAVRGR